MDTNEFLAAEELRAKMYAMLSQCYRRPDDRLMPVADELISTAKTVWPELIPDLDFVVAGAVPAATLEQISVDHARLFVGPYSLPAPPYGSVYLEGERKLMGDSTLDVLRHYHASGLQLAGDFNDAPDHIAAELEFMHYLVCKECAAIEQGDRESVMEWLAKQHEFLEAHLGLWMPEFTGAILNAAPTDFFRLVAICTWALIGQDLADGRRILARDNVIAAAC